MAVLVIGSADANVASGLSHDDTKNDALFNAYFGRLKYGVVNAADILSAVTCLEHLGLVDFEA